MKIVLNACIDEELKMALYERADQQGRSYSSVINEALWMGVPHCSPPIEAERLPAVPRKRPARGWTSATPKT